MLMNLGKWTKSFRTPKRPLRRNHGHSLRLESLEQRSLLAAVIGGSASITLQEGFAAAIGEFDAYFTASATRAQSLSQPAPGDAPFTETPADPSFGTITLSDPIRPSGEVPLNDAGGTTPGAPGASRTRQATTLQIENLSNVLGSWSTSNDAFAFVGNSVRGEQIAFTGLQRWTGPFTGSLVYGDFGLRYTGSPDQRYFTMPSASE